MSTSHPEKLQNTYNAIRKILVEACSAVTRAVNFTMVQAYWHVGRVIVEEEQRGADRAKYGKFLLKELAKRLSKEFGKGFTKSNLRYFRQFYLTFPVTHHALRDVFEEGDRKQDVLRRELSWTHYRLLLKVGNSAAREWYMHEAADCVF